MSQEGPQSTIFSEFQQGNNKNVEKKKRKILKN